MNLISRADTKLFYWMFNKANRQHAGLSKWTSKTGDGQLYLLMGIFLWWFEPKHGGLFLYTALLAYALQLPLYLVLKAVFKRQRPCDLLTNLRAHVTPSDKFSLPSGHTAAAFLMAALIVNFYPFVAPVAYTWATLIGISRILLGVHYPSDIIAGAVLGLLISYLSLLIML